MCSTSDFDYMQVKFKAIMKVKPCVFSISQVKPNDSSNECREVGVLLLRLLVAAAKASS